MEVSPKDCASLGAQVMQCIAVTGGGIFLMRIYFGMVAGCRTIDHDGKSIVKLISSALVLWE